MANQEGKVQKRLDYFVTANGGPVEDFVVVGGLSSFSIRRIRAGGCLALSPYSEKHGECRASSKTQNLYYSPWAGFYFEIV